MTDITDIVTPLVTLTALTVDEKRAWIFNVGVPFEISAEEFDDEVWPLVSNIWAKHNSRSPNAGPWISYLCRFAKRSPSSSRKEGVPSEKRRKTSVRPAGLCSAKIRVRRLDAGKRVRIERYNGSPDHEHSIEDSDKLKFPDAIKNLGPQAIQTARHRQHRRGARGEEWARRHCSESAPDRCGQYSA